MFTWFWAIFLLGAPVEYYRENFEKNKRFLRGAFFRQNKVILSTLWAIACSQAIWTVWKGCFEKMALYRWNKREFWTNVFSTFFQKEWNEAAFIPNDFSWSSRAFDARFCQLRNLWRRGGIKDARGGKAAITGHSEGESREYWDLMYYFTPMVLAKTENQVWLSWNNCQ